MGGLGNQLFQFTAARYIAGEQPILLDYSLSNPRTSNNGTVDIEEFVLSEKVVFNSSSQKNFVLKKLVGLNVRRSIKLGVHNRFDLIKLISEIGVSAHFRRYFHLKIGHGVGFSELNATSRNTILIGYFQSYRFAQAIKNSTFFETLKLKSPSPTVNYYYRLAQIEKPLVVHFRLGDYKNEPSIGILSPGYYKEALMKLWNPSNFGKIWAFSDDIEAAKDLYGSAMPNKIRWVPEIEKSAARTLEVMRLGRGYIIANSTFSWWSAFLTYTDNAPIISPNPWFKEFIEPAHLIPPNWTRLNGWQ